MGLTDPHRQDDAIVILLADDETSVRGVIEAMLRRAPYRLLIASNGIEALGISRAYAGNIDILLSDVEMPEMTGQELARIVLRERPGIRVLLLSANPEHASESELPFLAKPFGRNDLEEKLREVLGDPSVATGAD